MILAPGSFDAFCGSLPGRLRLPLREAAFLFLAASIAVNLAQAAPNPRIDVAPTQHGVKVTVDGKLFTEYRTDSGGRPVLWPVYGPTGDAITRSYPVGPRLEGEKSDHPHQRGIWFGHQLVGGVDFWHDPAPKKLGKKCGWQKHREFVLAESDGATARIITRNDWIGPDGQTVIANDQRTLLFGASKANRWIDFSIEMRGADGPLELGDAKDGLFAVRVAGSMRVEAGLGGQIVNSRGMRGKACWGLPAAWVDYHGPVGDHTAGIAIFSHPGNPRPTPRWHVRPYGLFAANPLGEEKFPKLGAYQQGAMRVESGDAIRFRFRILLHEGNETKGRVAEFFKKFAASDWQPSGT